MGIKNFRRRQVRAGENFGVPKLRFFGTPNVGQHIFLRQFVAARATLSVNFAIASVNRPFFHHCLGGRGARLIVSRTAKVRHNEATVKSNLTFSNKN